MCKATAFILLISLLSSSYALQPKKSVGIIGAGSGGLTAAWALAYAGYNVTVYESYRVVGGHAYTHPFKNGKKIVPVDLGAQYIAPRRYPNTAALFQTYKIRMAPWPWNFESSIFGQQWSTTNNEWNQTNYWKSMMEKAKVFEDSMPQAFLEPPSTSVASWCSKLGLGLGFQTGVLTPMMMFIMQTLLSPIQEVASFFVEDLYSFFGDVEGWERPGDGLGATWEFITSSALRQLPNLKVKTNHTVTSIGLCGDQPLSCSVNVQVGGNTYTYHHDYLVSGMNRNQLLKVLRQSTNQAGVKLSRDNNFSQLMKVLSSEIMSPIPTFLHTDVTVMDKDSPSKPTMYQFYNTLYTHNYLQQDITRAGYNKAPLVSYKPIGGLGWSPKSSEIQMKRDFSVPFMSTQWVMDGRAMSKTFNGLSNFWFCGGLLNGDYQESAVITGLMVAESLGADYPYAENQKAYEKFKEWSAMMKGRSLSEEQVKANGLRSNWIKNVRV